MINLLSILVGLWSVALGSRNAQMGFVRKPVLVNSTFWQFSNGSLVSIGQYLQQLDLDSRVEWGSLTNRLDILKALNNVSRHVTGKSKCENKCTSNVHCSEIVHASSQTCASIIGEHISTNRNCSAQFNSRICWPETSPGELVSVECPRYVPEYDEGVIERKCKTNGQWSNTNISCGVVERGGEQLSFLWYRPTIYCLYGISIAVAVFSVIVLVCFKKLHCTRNYIHINLLIAFIIRAVANLFYHTLPPGTKIYKYCSLHPDFEDTYAADYPIVANRVFNLFFYFAITSTFSWMLAEGLFLHNAVFVVFYESKFIFCFMIGWGIPLVCCVIEIIVHLTVDNHLNWRFYLNYDLEWLYKAPILFCLLINFILFFRIAVELFSKLQHTTDNEVKRYKKMLKSLAILVLMFGSHHFVALTYIYIVPRGPGIAWVIPTLMETLLSAIEGFLVSIIYCLANVEVQHELRKLTYRIQRYAWYTTLRDRLSKKQTFSTYSSNNNYTMVYSKTSLNQAGLVIASESLKGSDGSPKTLPRGSCSPLVKLKYTMLSQNCSSDVQDGQGCSVAEGEGLLLKDLNWRNMKSQII